MNNLLRISGIIVSAILAALPWLITTDSDDPFLFHGWAIYAAAALAICLLSVVFLFFRPRQRQVPFAQAFLLLFAAITVSTLLSNFIVSLRTALTWLSLMVLAGFLRLCRHQADNLNVATMIVLSGFFMAVYGLFQAAGYDVISWASDYRIVGTLSNPNFYTIFLATTSIVSLGLCLNQSYRFNRTRTAFWAMTVVQILAIIMTNRSGAILSLLFGIVLLFSSFWEVRPGRLLRHSPFISGLLIALILVAAHGLVYYATSTYPWDLWGKFSHSDYPIITRIILWQMGYAIFMQNPTFGLGPGAVPYLLPLQRPTVGSALGIKIFNDDPHSWVVTILGEIGFIGLFSICSILAIAYGCGTWRRSKNQRIDDVTTHSFPDDNLSWSLALVVVVVSTIIYWCGLIDPATFTYSFPLSILVFGLHNLFASFLRKDTPVQPANLAKITLSAMLTFLFHGLYNNSFTVLPLLAFIILVFSLHFSVCLRDVAWKRRFSFLSLVFICLPAMYVFTAYNFQIAYHREQINLALGEKQLGNKRFAESQKAFECAIQANPQSLKAHYGLALSLEQQNRLDETQDILKRLDSMVPNIFNTNFELARILFERNQVLEAHKYALKSLQWDQIPKVYELLGRILLMEGKQNEAEKIFEEGLLLIPPNHEEQEAADRIRLNLAALMANRGDFEKCQSYLQQIKSELRENVDFIYLQGMLLSRSQKYAQALELFEKALEKAPHNPRMMNAVGYILTTLNQDLERAANLLEEAYQNIKRTEPPPLSELLMVAHSLGNLYWKQGKLDEARQLLEIAWSQCPSEWRSLRNERFESLKLFYQETGRTQELETLIETGAN
ncbi:MAG: tetratricopeptide repeat protein [Candidatus Riflebacteria bacterium]|nr:tetratricopeptide repeat protein [Candidatus Riflebacteria bacterium]